MKIINYVFEMCKNVKTNETITAISYLKSNLSLLYITDRSIALADGDCFFYFLINSQCYQNLEGA